MTLSFTRRQRLLKTGDFSSVFSLRRSQSNGFFQVWIKPNDLAVARLGVVVSKKIERRAVGRNYIKRTVRELFRHHQVDLVGWDIIVRAKCKLHRQQGAEARSGLSRLFKRFSNMPIASSKLPNSTT